MIEAKTKFKIDIFKNKNHDGTWNLGICLIHYFEETYIRIDFFKWNISIGKLYYFDNVESDNIETR